MESDETEMNYKAEDPQVLRDYLLGRVKDDVLQNRIEMELMTNDEFAARLDAIEHELVEEYLDRELGDEDARQFEEFFLATPEGRRHLRLTENLRTFSVGAGNVVPQAKRSLFDRNATPSMHWLRFAFASVVIAGGAFGIWRFAFSESNTEKAMAEMRRAYIGKRPAEARLSAFPEHAPYSQTRGKGVPVTDPAARDRARSYLSDATRGAAEEGSHHALGLLYLAEMNFERAEQEFNLALKVQPESASLHSDLGAMYLERARIELFEWSPRGLVSLDLSLKHLDRAIELSPQMPEPRFNRALALDAMKLPPQAKTAWEEYLQIDSSSKWADEARRHIQQIDETAAVELTADELEFEFLAAMREGNEAAASDLIGNNRELIREKYLPQRLAISYLNAPPDRRDELLSAMRYAGELEMKRGDPFAREIALFYSGLDGSKFDVAREAQAEILAGYRKCLADAYGDSIPHFQRARNGFERLGNSWEAAISGYFVAYALLNIERVDESLIELKKTGEFAVRGKYVWLDATVNYWIGGVNSKMGRHSDARRAHERAVVLADRLQDSYSAQRNLIELARLSSTGGQRLASLAHVRRLLEENERPGNSIRQRFRNLSFITEIFTDHELLNAASAVALSAIDAGKATGSNFSVATSMTKAGDVCIRMGDHNAAKSLMESGLTAALAIEDTKSRDKTSAFCYMKLADLERERREFETAKQHYQKAIEFYVTAAMPFFLVKATNGLLLTELALGNTTGIEEGIAEGIRFAEEYRDRIADEQEKTGYFDRSIGIYEIAASFEFDRGNYEKAYDYAERSSSRSLLDWLRKGSPPQTGSEDRPLSSSPAEPESLGRIRERMPDRSQLVQYTVLNDRVLVWLVSKERFTAHSLPVDSAVLANKVGEFRQGIELRDEKASGLARELYDLLIAPVKEQIDTSKEISIVPSGVLFTLPYAALTSPDGKPLIAEYNLTYSPSANVFLHITEKAAEIRYPEKEMVLAVGDPAFDREAFDGLPYLSGAEREATKIAEFYDEARTLTGRGASKPAIRAAMTKANVLHFAGHYVVEPQSPMSSYLLLAANGAPESSRLSNAEMARQDLSKMRLIVLAACRTGTETYTAGEGLIGLSRTFLGANVPLVIGSQWSVDSEATADLMVRFHRHRRLGRLQTAAALRAAQLELLNDATGRYTAPYYWSAFAVYGGHAGF